MIYRITFNQPLPLQSTKSKLNQLQARVFENGKSTFFSYGEKYFELLEDNQSNIIGMSVHGNSISDFRSLMNIKDKLFID